MSPVVSQLNHQFIGMSARNLRYMQKFASEFENDEFLQGVLAKLSWNHNQILLDQVKDKRNTDELWAENITIAEAMKKLNDKEKLIIGKRFFEGRTQMEVANEIGISQAQVSRLEKSGLDNLKRMID